MASKSSSHPTPSGPGPQGHGRAFAAYPPDLRPVRYSTTRPRLRRPLTALGHSLDCRAHPPTSGGHLHKEITMIWINGTSLR
ncbi:Hypothetical protein PFR_JS25-2_46, partial [Propionibacterium freudenreichii]